jgi:pimeloyl-ACP methyl ester carboxylesterase
MTQANAGYFRSGLPYNRFGRGPRPLVIFQGLMFENKSQSPLVTQMYHQFAADHPDLVRRLVIHSAACRLNPAAEAMQMAMDRLATEGRWREAWAILLRITLPPGPLAGPQIWPAAWLTSLDAPKDPSDLTIAMEAEETRRTRSRGIGAAETGDWRFGSRCYNSPIVRHSGAPFRRAVH